MSPGTLWDSDTVVGNIQSGWPQSRGSMAEEGGGRGGGSANTEHMVVIWIDHIPLRRR